MRSSEKVIPLAIIKKRVVWSATTATGHQSMIGSLEEQVSQISENSLAASDIALRATYEDEIRKLRCAAAAATTTTTARYVCEQNIHTSYDIRVK